MAKDYLAYYAQESNQYREYRHSPISMEQVRAVVPKIFFRFASANVSLRVSRHQERFSYYQSGNGLVNPRHNQYCGVEEIVIRYTMVNWITIAHEIAHALHTHDYNLRYWIRLANRGELLPKERWHGKEHRYWMDKVMNYLKDLGVVVRSENKIAKTQLTQIQQ